MVGSFLEYFLGGYFGEDFLGRVFGKDFFGGGICLRNSLFLFGCSTAAAKQQMASNFELVISDQLFSVVLA